VPIPMREVLHRGREFFMGQSDVHEAAERICRALDEMNIPYALCGGLAVGRILMYARNEVGRLGSGLDL